MITPRAALSSSRGGTLDEEAMSPRNTTTLNLGQFQRKCFEGLSQTQGKLTADILKGLHGIVRNAMLSGRCHCRLQTLRLSRDFSYRYRQVKDGYHLHDAYTLEKLDTHAQISFMPHMLPFVEWMRAQGIHFICTTKLMKDKVVMGDLPLADFCHVEAIFIPEDTDLREQQGRTLSLWNTVYTAKCLDGSMVPEWNKRLLAAIKTGAAHAVISTLYLGSDYEPLKTETAEEEDASFNCTSPRHHLTMQLLEARPRFRLDCKFRFLVGWVAQLGYEWTLTCGEDREGRCSPWAYFVVMLDPLEKYF